MDANSEFPETAVQCVAFDFEAVFRDQYSQIARVIARIVNNPARAEELCVDVLWIAAWLDDRFLAIGNLTSIAGSSGSVNESGVLERVVGLEFWPPLRFRRV